MAEIRVEVEVPNDCRECDHRYGNECWLFDRVMGVPIERAVLPKGVQFIVAERKVKENEK